MMVKYSIHFILWIIAKKNILLESFLNFQSLIFFREALTQEDGADLRMMLPDLEQLH